MAACRRAALPAGATDPGTTATAPATRGALRVARGLVVAAVVLGLSLGGHVLAGGAAPWPAVVVLGLLTAVACIALSRREWGPLRLVAVLTAAEVVLHSALTWADSLATVASRAPAPGSVTDAVGGAAGAVDAMTIGGMVAGDAGVGSASGPAATGMAGMAGMAGMDPRGMLLGHAAAVLLAAAFLRFGEARLWRLLAASLAPWHRDLRLTPSRPTRSTPVVSLPVPAPRVRTRLFADVPLRRGPPLAAA